MVNPKLDSLYQRLPAPLCACGWSRWNQWPPNGGGWIWCVRSADLAVILRSSLFYWPQKCQKWIWALNFEGSPMCRWRADFWALQLWGGLVWFLHVQVESRILAKTSLFFPTQPLTFPWHFFGSNLPKTSPFFQAVPLPKPYLFLPSKKLSKPQYFLSYFPVQPLAKPWCFWVRLCAVSDHKPIADG